MASKIEGNLVIVGDLKATTMQIPDAAVGNDEIMADAEIARSKLALDSNKIYSIPLTQCRVWDAPSSLLPSAGANDDLGIYPGTFGTHAVQVKTGDVKAATTTRRLIVQVPIPAEYDDGETITIRIRAGMETTVADGTATVDVEAYLPDGAGAVGSDLCATAAQSINSLTDADKDFVITSTGIVAGDVLDVRITIAVTDSATATAVIGAIQSIKLLADVRG